MRHPIIITHSAGGWLADFSQTPEAEETQRLLGATTLPTPFAAGVPAHIVVARLAALNPDCRIMRQCERCDSLHDPTMSCDCFDNGCE